MMSQDISRPSELPAAVPSAAMSRSSIEVMLPCMYAISNAICFIASADVMGDAMYAFLWKVVMLKAPFSWGQIRNSSASSARGASFMKT